MIRRLAVAALAALCATTAVPADAAAPVKLYLNQQGVCSTTGPVFTITTFAEDSGSCVFIPREQVNGEGVVSDNESFTSSKKLKTVKLDTSKPLTGTFALFGSSLLNVPAVPGGGNIAALVAADLTIKVAKKTVGTVHVEGVALPTTPVSQTFSLKLPAALKNVKTNSIQVNVTWITCVGFCGVSVSGTSFMTLPVK